MLSFILVLWLLSNIMVGFRRGFMLQAVHIAGLLISFAVAWLYYDELASIIELWVPYPFFDDDSTIQLMTESFQTSTVFYNGVAFVLIFITVKILTQIIGSMFDFIANLPILHTINGLLGAVLGFVEGLIILAVLLHLAALIQVDVVQEILQGSSVAQWIYYYTPMVSAELRDLWVEGIRE
ncbi:CvpA family protein [Alkalicoccus chagannorensis]|uniref:CvpA family protein n=1 Tax=Alkalicoccus chagannorensis TaxID=427072 RepID=UPI000415553E|nr:CvpA family protein [Alkalicoccus chagannorensis]